MKQKSPHRQELRLLVISLALIVLGSFFAMLFNTSFFSVQVKEITFTTERGTLSALLYLPKGAGADDPRPVVVTTHGYLNTKEMQDAPAIEMSRRGYVVLDLDMYDHGDSRWNGDMPVGSQFGTFWVYSMSDAANWAAQQPFTKKDDAGNSYISVSGHSMGGFSTLAALYMDEMQALQTGTRNIYTGIDVGADFSFAAAIAPQDQYQAAFGSRTVGIIAAHYDEFFFNKSDEEKTPEEQKVTGTVTYKDFVATNSGKAFLGFAADESPAAGQFYKADSGEVLLDGNAVRASQTGERVIYTPSQTHPWNHFSKTTTADLITFYTHAFDGVTAPSQTSWNLAADNQVWMFKELFNFVALIGFFLLFVPLISLLLKLPFLKRAVVEATDPLPQAKTSAGKTAGWLAMLISATLPALLFARLMDKTDADLVPIWITALFVIAVGVIAALVGRKNGDKQFVKGGLWFGGVGLVLFVVLRFGGSILSLSSYFVEPTVNQIAYWALVNGLIAALLLIGFYYVGNRPAGAQFAQYGISRSLPVIGASIATALAAVVLGYGLLFGIQAVFGVDFRIWTLAVRTFKVEHLLVTLRYLPVFFIFYFVNTVALNANTRGRRGGTALAIGLNIGGLVAWLALQYGLDFATGVALYPTQGMNGILLIALVPCLAIAAVFARRLYEKTNNVWLAACLNATLFTMITCANTVLFWHLVNTAA